ncbi:hypothetical protein [Propionivibrio sp.]|uniref:hypothetical protein n=1 Tax=Propionivibrio sp. TaxID=2212460 RepID=UPI002621A665|nr:hypothetical protein [Propionivibrio sp.]
MDVNWASTHDGNWPNVTDLPVAWDSCTYLAEKSGDPEWVMFLLCPNDAGGPVYYVPKICGRPPESMSTWRLPRQSGIPRPTSHN